MNLRQKKKLFKRMFGNNPGKGIKYTAQVFRELVFNQKWIPPIRQQDSLIVFILAMTRKRRERCTADGIKRR